MNIITTPMCKEILDIVGIKEYKTVTPNNIKNADIAILLSETKTEIPTIKLKLNTYTQIYNSIKKVQKKFEIKTINDTNKLNLLKILIKQNKTKTFQRNNIKVKVYTEFLKELVEDMGFEIVNENYKYIIIPDYLKDKFSNKKNIIIVPSHKHVPKESLKRAQKRYELLEEKICMKQ